MDIRNINETAQMSFVNTDVIAQCRKPAAHSSTFGLLPTRIAQTKKPKELEFFPTHGRQK